MLQSLICMKDYESGVVIDVCAVETFLVKDSIRKDRNIQREVLSLLQRIVILV